jgi:hypothetical protein
LKENKKCITLHSWQKNLCSETAGPGSGIACTAGSPVHTIFVNKINGKNWMKAEPSYLQAAAFATV